LLHVIDYNRKIFAPYERGDSHQVRVPVFVTVLRFRFPRYRSTLTFPLMLLWFIVLVQCTPIGCTGVALHIRPSFRRPVLTAFARREGSATLSWPWWPVIYR